VQIKSYTLILAATRSLVTAYLIIFKKKENPHRGEVGKNCYEKKE